MPPESQQLRGTRQAEGGRLGNSNFKSPLRLERQRVGVAEGYVDLRRGDARRCGRERYRTIYRR